MAHHLKTLGDAMRDELTPRHRDEFDRLTGPDSPASMRHRPDLEFTCLNTLYTARKPREGGGRRKAGHRVANDGPDRKTAMHSAFRFLPEADP